MALHLITSNHLETLAKWLADLLATAPGDALRPQVVVTQSQGMARWLKLELARRLGICANVRFPFPETFATDTLTALLEVDLDECRVDRDALAWRLMHALPPLLVQPAFAAVRHYLRDRADTRRLFQFAARSANLFDQYLIFRPEMVRDWDAGRDDHWQAQLWRAVTGGTNREQPAALQARLDQLLHSATGRDDMATGLTQHNLPAQIAVFGISALPPYHVRLFAALGQWLDVHFFLLQPSKEFWGDISTSREAGHVLRGAGRGAADAEAFHLEEGNRLLASMGKLGRDFLGLILDAGDWRHREDFVESGEATLLTAIQSDILHLRNRGRDGTPRLAILAGDDSLQIHSCHSPMREMEVLRDHLLDWFQRDSGLAPRDVLVMMPDIETYAPFIQAVFDAPETGAQRIPFSLADRSPRRQSHVIETFLALLNLAGSRLTAPAVLALFEAPPVRTRFGFGERDLATVRHWIEETRIRWGRDAADRARAGLPPLAQNTWRAGLDRLLLGYAMAGGESQLFGGILPLDDIEGEPAALLGRFAGFLEKLFATLERCEQPHTLRDWTSLLLGVLGDFFPDDDDTAELELRQARDVVLRLTRLQDQSGFTAPVDLAVVLEQLTHDLAEDTFGSGFLAGGVTFCALKPMRSIPFKVICVVGLNDGAFPRANPQLGFDLMAANPRRGDRSMREDDRYLFLETILSARRRLYLSYVGQSLRDNSVRPPSVLIGELLDYVEQGFSLSADDGGDGFHSVPASMNEDGNAVERVPAGAIRERLVRIHRLQAFSEDYFRAGTGLFSYSAENCLAGRERLGRRGVPPALFTQSLDTPGPEWRTVDLESLRRFFRNPARFFLERRLSLRFVEGEAALDDREPFEVAGLARYRIEQSILARALAGAAAVQTATLVQAQGDLPLGPARDAILAELQRDADALRQRLARFAPEQPRPPLLVDLTVGEFQITGRLERRTATGLLHYRCAKLKATDLLAAWIEHLAWNVLRPAGDSLTSAVVAKDATFVFPPNNDAQARLELLLALYWRGLRAPLKFFPETSRAFVEAERKATMGGRSSKNPLAAARTAWEGSSFQNGPPAERDDPWFALCFRDLNDPLDEEFVALARTVFEPLLAAVQKGEA